MDKLWIIISLEKFLSYEILPRKTVDPSISIEKILNKSFINYRFLDDIREEATNLTIFEALCNSYCNAIWSSEFSGMGLDKTVKDKCRDIFVTFIEKFIVTYSPCMEVEITIKEKVQQFLPLLSLANIQMISSEV